MKLGTWWNNDDIKIYEIEGRPIALYGWNGEHYMDCFEVADEINGRWFESVRGGIEVCPIYEERSGDYEIIGYEII